MRPVLRGRLGRLFVAIALFEVGNASTTLLILRATDAFRGGRTEDAATQLALALYVAYNVAATFASYPAGWLGDRRAPGFAFAFGVACFAVAYSGFALATGPIALAAWFVLAGFGIAAVETAEHSAVATLAPAEVRGSAFGLLAGVQSGGNLAASAVAGVLWSLVSPTAAFVYLAAFMLLSLLAVATVVPGTRGGP